ncbi:MAG: helix-turn-helix domain-containing protein [Oscillospiraceae bacterium]|nr:helix-turn-helix domain-containing protein [Oscillospiraceae bacterium]
MIVFIERLKLLRKEHNITQKQLGEAIGASERGIQNYELNERKPAYDVLIALANYFNVSLDYLTGRSDEPEINKKEK